MPNFARILRGVLVGSLAGALLVALPMALLGMGSFFPIFFGGAFALLFGAFSIVNAPLLYALHRIGWRDWWAVAFAGGLSTMIAFIVVEWIARGEIGPVAFVIRPTETILFVILIGVATGCVGWWAANARTTN